MNTQNTTPPAKSSSSTTIRACAICCAGTCPSRGFNVFVAEDAKEMGKLWQREHFDLLVLDLMLPGEDGLSICRRLRGGHDNTPIIMLTAKAEEIDRIVGLEMGADDYLSSRSILASCWPGSTRSCAAAAPRSIPAPPARKTNPSPSAPTC